MQRLQAWASGAVCKEVVQQKKGDGAIVTVELYVNEIEISGQRLFQISIVDISDKVHTQQALEKDKEKFRGFIDQSSEGIYCHEFEHPFSVNITAEEMMELLTRDGRISECNDTLARMYGYEKASDLIGVLPNQLIDFSDPANKEYFRILIENGFRIIDAESHEKDKEGNSRYFLNNVIGIVEDGLLKQFWGTQRDITERKKIEEKLRLLATLVEETSDVLTASDLDFIPVTWNRAAEKIYGLTAEQVIGRSVREHIDIDYGNLTREDVRSILKEKGEWRGEMYFIRPTDEKAVTLLASFKLLKDESGQPAGYVIAATDITERKEVELKLAESESRFRDVADSAPVLIWMSDADNKLSYINKRMADYTGLDQNVGEKPTWASLLHPDDVQGSLEKFGAHFQKKLPVTLVYRLKNACGKYRWVQDSGTPRLLNDGTFLGYIGSIVDIHDTKAKEEEASYQATVLENVQDVIVSTDLNFVVKSWNKLAEELYDLPEKEAVSKEFNSLVQYEFVNSDRETFYKTFEEKGLWKGEVIHKDKNGETKYFVYTVTYVRDKDGEKIGILTVGKDITDRKKAEGRLKQSEQFYRSLIADSLDGILLLNSSGIITFVSPSIRHILGYETEDIAGSNAFTYVHPEDFSWALQSFNKEVTENPEVKFIVVRLLRKNGSWVWCTVRGHNLLDNPYVNSIAIYLHDDTLRKNASDALKASEQRFRSLISDLQVGVLLLEANGEIIVSNNVMMPTCCNLLEEALIGKLYLENV